MRAQQRGRASARPVNTRPPNFWSLDKTAPRGFHTLMLCMQICLRNLSEGSTKQICGYPVGSF